MRMGTAGRAAIAIAAVFIASSASFGEATGAARGAVLAQYTVKGQPIRRRRSRGFEGLRPGVRRPFLYHRVGCR